MILSDERGDNFASTVARGLCWLGISAIAGCTVGPEFRRPDTPKSAYEQPPATVGTRTFQYGSEVADDWYTLFGSDRLNQLVRQSALP